MSSVIQGRLELITGCMFSGKSTEINRLKKRLEHTNKKVILINHSTDTRYSHEGVATHDHMVLHSVMLSELSEIVEETGKLYKEMLNTDIIIIDEFQFFDAGDIAVLELVNKYNKEVICVGLTLDINNKFFGCLYKLFGKQDCLKVFNAYCGICEDGTEALFTISEDRNQEIVKVGAEETYTPVCRHHYNEWKDKN